MAPPSPRPPVRARPADPAPEPPARPRSRPSCRVTAASLMTLLALLHVAGRCDATSPAEAHGADGRLADDRRHHHHQQLQADDAGGGGKQLVFHHVYNINVGGSECPGQAGGVVTSSGLGGGAGGAAGGAGGGQVDGGGGAVFTHKVVVAPPVPCHQRPHEEEEEQQRRLYHEQVSHLLSRVDLLEGEVASLRSLCAAPPHGCCASNAIGCGNNGDRMALTGETMQRDPCSGRGTLDPGTRACVCEPEWTGPDCTLRKPPQVLKPGGLLEGLLDAGGGCAGGCGRGRCVAGACDCGTAYTGPGCLIPAVQAQPCPQGSDGPDCPKAPEPITETVPTLAPSSTVAPTPAIVEIEGGGGGVAGGDLTGDPISFGDTDWDSVLLSRLTIRTVTCVDKEGGSPGGGQGGSPGGGQGGAGAGAGAGGRRAGAGGDTAQRRRRPPSSDEPDDNELGDGAEDATGAGGHDHRAWEDGRAGGPPVSVLRVGPSGLALAWEPRDITDAPRARVRVRWWPAAEAGAGAGGGDAGEVTVPGDASLVEIAGLREASEYRLEVHVVGRGQEGPATRLSVTTASSKKFLQNPPPSPAPSPSPHTSTTVILASTAASPSAASSIGLVASDVTPTSFRISWFPDQLVFDSYTVRYRSLDDDLLVEEVEDKLAPKLDTGRGGAAAEAGGASDKAGGARKKAGGATGKAGGATVKVGGDTGKAGGATVKLGGDSGKAGGAVKTLGVASNGDRGDVGGDDGGWRELLFPGAARSAVISDLEEGHLYEVVLLGVSRAAVRGLAGPPPPRSEPLRLATGLQPVRGLTVSKISPTAARVVWAPVSPRALGVRISWFAPHVQGRGGAVRSALVTPLSRTLTLTRLAPLTRYEVGAVALRGALRSPDATTSFTTALDPPRAVRVGAVGPWGARVSWKPPAGEASGFSVVYENSNATHEESREVRAPAGQPWADLSGLSPGTRYSVSVTAESSGTRSQPAVSHLLTAQLTYPLPRDCAQVLLNYPEQRSGVEQGREVHVIYLGGDAAESLRVTCDMTTDGGGWTVMQRRESGRTSFLRGWDEYESGFGDPAAEFWIGLRALHALSSHARYELRVELGDGQARAYAQYDRLAVGDAGSLYRLRLGGYRGDAGDSLTYHHGRPFSTPDRDNDGAAPHCAEAYLGGWWYRNCHRANLNGRYGDTSHSRGVNWVDWRGHEGSLSFVEMKLRPPAFRESLAKRRRRHGV